MYFLIVVLKIRNDTVFDQVSIYHIYLFILFILFLLLTIYISKILCKFVHNID